MYSNVSHFFLYVLYYEQKITDKYEFDGCIDIAGKN